MSPLIVMSKDPIYIKSKIAYLVALKLHKWFYSCKCIATSCSTWYSTVHTYGHTMHTEYIMSKLSAMLFKEIEIIHGLFLVIAM